MITVKDGIYRIGSLKLDTNQKELWISNELKTLQPKQYAFLLFLVKNESRFVEKEELMKSVWSDAIVEDQRLNITASDLRKILGGSDAILNKPVLNFKFNSNFFLNKDKITCPWMGFKSYDEDNEDLFYGRDDDINNIVYKLQNKQYLLTLFGSSGVGKTSLVNAGLIPKLKKGEDIPGSDDWKFISLRPTHHPLWDLSRKIASLKSPNLPLSDEIVDPIFHSLRTNPKSIIQELNDVPEQKLFLFIDQIEGLLSRDTDKIEAELFVEALLQLLENEEIVQRVIINLRDSFHQSLSYFKELYSLLTGNLIPIGELTEEQLNEVIEKPARLVGLELEEGLSNQIIKDLVADTTSYSGVLPLLSNFLVELFECRDGAKITLSHYLSIGGIKDSIGRYANEVYKKFNKEEKEIVEKLLILLTDVGEKPMLDSCKSVAEKNILKTFPGQEEEVQKIIQKLIEERLLVSWEDTENTVELPHSSLIRNWTKMQLLLEKNRSAVRVAESLERQTQYWFDSGKNTDDLYKGARLQIAEEHYEQYKPYIGKNENEFFNASISSRSEAEKKSYRENQKKRFYIGLTLTAIILILALIYMSLSYQYANNQFKAAKTAADAQMELDRNPTKAINLAVQAAKLEQTEDTIAILQAAITGSYLKMSLKGHVATLTAVAISPDGKLLLTSSRDKTARIWNSDTGGLLHKLEGHTNQVESASFSPDGRYAVTSSSDSTVRIWDVADGKEVKRIETQTGVNNVVFSPDGKFILTAGENDTATVWDYTSSEKPILLLSHPKKQESENLGINSAVFSLDGKLIATGGGDKTAIIWDAVSGEIQKILPHPDSVLNLAFSPDGKVLVTACKDGVARVWKIEDWSLQSELRGHKGQVNCVAFDSSGKKLVTASMDTTAIIWDWQRGKNLLSLKGHRGALTSAVFSPDGNFVYTSSGDMEAKVWKIYEDFDPKDFIGHQGEVFETAFNSDGKMLLTASRDKTVRIWETTSGKLLKIFTHSSAVRSAKFSPDTKSIATATEDGKVYFWDIESEKIMKEFSGHQSLIRSVAFDPTGKFLASGDKNGIVRLWEVSSGNQIDSFGIESDRKGVSITDLVFSRNGKILAASSEDRSVKIWDVMSPSLISPYIWTIGTGSINSVSFSIDSNKLLVSGDDKSLRVWDKQVSKQVDILLGHTEKATHAEYSPDGKFIVSVSEDNTLRIWSAYLQRELYRIEVLTLSNKNNQSKESILSTSFSSNGKDIAYSNNYGLVRVIRCPICSVSKEELINIAIQRLPKDSMQ